MRHERFWLIVTAPFLVPYLFAEAIVEYVLLFGPQRRWRWFRWIGETFDPQRRWLR